MFFLQNWTWARSNIIRMLWWWCREKWQKKQQIRIHILIRKISHAWSKLNLHRLIDKPKCCIEIESHHIIFIPICINIGMVFFVRSLTSTQLSYHRNCCYYRWYHMYTTYNVIEIGRNKRIHVQCMSVLIGFDGGSLASHTLFPSLAHPGISLHFSI